MGLLSQILAQHAQKARDEHLADIADRKNKQDLALSHLDSMMPMVAPEDQPGLQQLILDTFGTPVTKYDPAKTAKALGDLMAQSHQRATGIAQEQSQKPPAPLSFQLPQGDAGGFQMPQMPPMPPPGQQPLPTASLPQPPMLRAGAPPQQPGMPTAMEMPGIAAPGPEVPGVIRPFVDPRRAMEQATSQLQAIGITDPRDIVNALNKHALTTPPARVAQIEEVAFMGYLQKAGGDPTKAFEMLQKTLHPEASAKELAPEQQAFDSLVAKTGDPVEALRQLKDITAKADTGLTKEQQEANAMYEARMRQTNPNFKLTPNDYAKARSLYDEERMTPDQIQQRMLAAENLKQLQALRSETMANTAMHMREWNATHGQDAVNSIVKQMKADPDVFFAKDMTPDLRNNVAQVWTQQTGMPPPREVPAQIKTKEANSVIAANAVGRIKKMLAENPVIQRRMGAWNGRVGNLEQAIGDTKGLSPQDAQVIQNFRSSVNYLFFQEGQALLQRSPQALMEELKVTSPSMKQGLPLFLGALDAVNGTASNNIQSANDYRFNRAPGSATSPVPPNPPAGVNPFRTQKK